MYKLFRSEHVAWPGHRSAVPAVVVVEAGAGVVVVVGPPHLVLQLAGQGQDVVHSCHQDVCLVNAEIYILYQQRYINYLYLFFIKVTNSEEFLMAEHVFNDENEVKNL